MKNLQLKIWTSFAALLVASPSLANDLEYLNIKPIAVSAVANETVQPAELDHIITGVGVSGEQMRQWKARKARYDACGLCGEIQPFPGDLPE